MMQAKVENLVVGYGKRAILNPMTFELPVDSSCLVIGQNGAGKSTLLKTIVGLQTALSGSIQIDGRSVTLGALPKLVPAGIRFLGQGDRGFRLLRAPQHRRVLARLYGFEEPSFNPDCDTLDGRVGSMSLGQRRLEAIRLLDCEPARMFILDEPTAGLDPQNILLVKDWMQATIKRGKSFIVVEHDYRSFSGVFDKLIIFKSPNLAYFGDMLPDDQIIGLIA
jgi:ABC-type multidrug transport system ATPase subunit